MGNTLRKALIATLPVLTGYLVLGFGFGILMQTVGFGILPTVAMSLLIYAGSMQFVAIGLITGGASLLTVALTTLLVNARHLFYGISMLDRYKGMGLKKFYLIFGLCDETFSINYTAKIPEGIDHGKFYFAVTLLNQIYWVAGSTVGGIFGSLIPFSTEGIDFVMTAMFVVIFMEQWKKEKNHIPSLLGLALSLICLLIFSADSFIIPAMIAILLSLTLLRKPLTKEEEEKDGDES